MSSMSEMDLDYLEPKTDSLLDDDANIVMKPQHGLKDEVEEPEVLSDEEEDAESPPPKPVPVVSQPEVSDTPVDVKRREHEEKEAKRKAEWEAKQAAKKEARQKEIAKIEAMGASEAVKVSISRLMEDAEKLTQRNMKICVTAHIQELCQEDPEFARLVLHPNKSIVHCFWYINRAAKEYLQKEMAHNQETPHDGIYGGDVPDGLCYEWAEAYYRDENAKEDEEREEKYVPTPYYGTGKPADKTKKQTKKAPKFAKKTEEVKEPVSDESQISLFGTAA